MDSNKNDERNAGKIAELIDKAVKKPEEDGKMHLIRNDKEIDNTAAGIEYIVANDCKISVKKLQIIKGRVESLINRKNISGFDPVVWVENFYEEQPVLQHHSIFVGIIEESDRKESEALITQEADE